MLVLLLTLSAQTVSLEPCRFVRGAECGTVAVARDPFGDDDDAIELRVLVARASGRQPEVDPLFFLAGGPGQAATELAKHILPALSKVRKKRDIVLVDQRGTGRSSPLDCEEDIKTLTEALHLDADLEKLKACLAGHLEAGKDPRLYTTRYAAADLDAVRDALGYARINLMGVSYGTRLALVHAQMFGATTRAIVLDGAAPLEIKLGAFAGQDAARATEHLEADLGKPLTDLALPQTVTVPHPRTGDLETLTFTRAHVLAILRGALYSPLTSSLVPLAMERAAAGDFRALAGLALAGDGDISAGLYLSVACSEDHPLITAEERAAIDKDVAASVLRPLDQSCPLWPKGKSYVPKSIDTRTLVLSGALDPVTPPRWGEVAAARSSQSTHLVFKATGHGVWSTACGRRVIADFLEDNPLKTECKDTLARPPFFKSELGP